VVFKIQKLDFSRFIAYTVGYVIFCNTCECDSGV